MEFLVNWDLEEEQGRGWNLTREIAAAETIEQDGYRACVVGDLASVVYGSKVVVSNVYIAVADDSLRSVLERLLQLGFVEEPQTQLRFRSAAPAKDCTFGWPGHRLWHPSREDDVGILLLPASLWHLDLDGPSFFSDTALFPGSKCRFPRPVPYLNGKIQFPPFVCIVVLLSYLFSALIETIIERESDDLLNPNLSRYILYQYYTILSLLPAHSISQLPIENQFFAAFYAKMLLRKSRLKFFSLWQKVRDGSLSTSDAIALLPRRDMYIAELKAKKEEETRRNRTMPVDTQQY